jgi:hypothetical protein
MAAAAYDGDAVVLSLPTDSLTGIVLAAGRATSRERSTSLDVACDGPGTVVRQHGLSPVADGWDKTGSNVQ